MRIPHEFCLYIEDSSSKYTFSRAITLEFGERLIKSTQALVNPLTGLPTNHELLSRRRRFEHKIRTWSQCMERDQRCSAVDLCFPRRVTMLV